MKPIKHPHLVGLIAVLPVMTFFAFGYFLGQSQAAVPSTTSPTGSMTVLPPIKQVPPPTPPQNCLSRCLPVCAAPVGDTKPKCEPDARCMAECEGQNKKPTDTTIKPVLISINQTGDDGRPEVLKFTCNKVAVESTSPTKSTPPPTPVTPVRCGDAICTVGETSSNCPMDCDTSKPTDNTIVGPGGTNPCGNGRCESGETLTNCPGDCKQLVNPKLNTIR